MFEIPRIQAVLRRASHWDLYDAPRHEGRL